MANNRMWLVCKICNPGELEEFPIWGSINDYPEDKPPVAIPISKWYSEGIHLSTYCVRHELDKFYQAHSHEGSEYTFRLDYETREVRVDL